MRAGSSSMPPTPTPARSTRWRASGAGVVLCPSTEANLGDGLADLPGWLAAGVPLSIGSDSHVTRDWREELRWLEYGQRLARRQRNVAAAPRGAACRRAPRACSRARSPAAPPRRAQARWGLVPGARADLLVVDRRRRRAARRAADRTRSTRWCSPAPGGRWRDVLVAGRWVIRDRVHAEAPAIAERFAATMHALG